MRTTAEGRRGRLLQPPDRAMVADGTRSALERAVASKTLSRCATISVISPKGGVGKTALSILLGELLVSLRPARRRRRLRLVEITASCDREAVVTGSPVTGDSADVRLASGAKLGLQRADGQWYITSISGGSPHAIKQGRCAGAGGA